MRLIDADALMKAFYKSIDDAVLHGGKIVPFQDIIQNAPTIDAVPVVRCKDCKHCEYASNRIPTEQAWVCYKLGIDVEQDWFCADGERKDNG